MYRFARKWTGSEHEAKDVVQNSFYNVYRKHSDFSGNSSESTWVHAIARYGCFHIHDRRKKRSEKELAHPEEIGPGRATARNVEGDRNRVLAHELLAIADDWTRTILSMVYLEGFTQEDAGRYLGVSRQTIWKTITLFRKKVKGMMPCSQDLLPMAYPDADGGGLSAPGVRLTDPVFRSAPVNSGLSQLS